MNDRIHHRCRCLGKDFTFQEWIDYCKDPSHDSAQIVMTYEEFGFNVHDVCMTPHVPVKLIVDARFYIAVRTAQSPNGRWTVGNNYGLGTGGGSCPVAFTDLDDAGFPSEREAVAYMLQRFMEACKRELERTGLEEDDIRRTNVKKLMKLVDDAIERWDPRQLTLF